MPAILLTNFHPAQVVSWCPKSFHQGLLVALGVVVRIKGNVTCEGLALYLACTIVSIRSMTCDGDYQF